VVRKRDFIMLKDGTVLWCATQGGWGHADVLSKHFGIPSDDEESLARAAYEANMLRGVYDNGMFTVVAFQAQAPGPHPRRQVTNAQRRELKNMAIEAGVEVAIHSTDRPDVLMPESAARRVVAKLLA
jgi:hypothetical protein